MSIATQLAMPSPASPDLYEHRGIVDLPENDTLAWIDETMEEIDESRCGVSSVD